MPPQIDDDQDQDQQKRLTIAPPYAVQAAKPVSAVPSPMSQAGIAQSVAAKPISPIAAPNSIFSPTGAPGPALSSAAAQPPAIAGPTSAPQPTAIAAPSAPTVASSMVPPSMGIPQSRIPALPPPTIQSGGARLWQGAKNVQGPLRIPAMIGAGIARAGDIGLEALSPRLASLVPGSEVNTREQNTANENKFERREQLGNQAETAEADKDRALTDQQRATTEQERADTEKYKAEHPTEKPTKGELVFDKAGNAIGYQDTDGTLMAPDNPKLPPDVKGILGSAKAKPAPSETATQNRLNFQSGVSKLAAEGLPTDPKKLESSIAKSNTLTPQEIDDMRGYMAANTTPATSLQVNIDESANKNATTQGGKYYAYSDKDGTHLVTGDKLPADADAVPIKDTEGLINEGRTANIIQKSLNQIHKDVNDHPEIFDSAAARAIIATTTEQMDRQTAGMLIAGTGGSVPLPSGLGDMINMALQNNGLDKKTGEAVRQYIADYKSMKDKVLTMQMEMQNGKIGRGNAQAFKAIADQIPGGGTPDSKTAFQQLANLQQTQSELMKKYPDKYGDFEKEKPFGASVGGNVPPPGARIRDYTNLGGNR